MMRAAGYTNEKEFFKAVENGQVMTADVMPKFAEELKKMSYANGALAKASEKTNAQMQRFFNTLSFAKDEIFQGGMDEGLSQMFADLSIVVKDLRPAFIAIGQTFKGFVSTISAGVRIITAPFATLFNIFEKLGLTTAGGGFIWNLVGSGGALFLLLKGFNQVAKAIGFANMTLLAFMGNLLRLAAPLLALEDFYRFMVDKNSDTFTKDLLNWAGGQGFADASRTSLIDGYMNYSPIGLLYKYNKMFIGNEPEVTVNIIPNGEEFKNAFTAVAEKHDERKAAAMQQENGG